MQTVPSGKPECLSTQIVYHTKGERRFLSTRKGWSFCAAREVNRSTTTTPSYPRRLPVLVAATLWAYQCLLALHPPGFRREYSTAIAQVFRQTCLDAHRRGGAVALVRLWPRALTDVLSGAFAEYAALLLQSLKGSRQMLQYRRSASVIFAAFIAFVIAGIGFQRSNEDIMKTSLPNTYPLLGVAYVTMEVGAAVALLAILVGGVPVALAALRYAFSHQRRDIVARFLVPPVALLVVIAAGLIVVTLNLGGNTPATLHTPARIATIGGIVALFIIAAIVSTYAVLSAIARSEIDVSLLRFTLLPGALATVAMLAMVAAQIVWGIGLSQVAPDVFSANSPQYGNLLSNSGLLGAPTLIGIVVQAVIMIVATLVAIRALAQGFSANRATPGLA